ncbi:hypothetical protein ZWY2020_001843, partial [Hordeum vulgare]
SPPASSGIPPRYNLDAKWDACLDLSIRRVAYSSLAGAFGGLILFRKIPPPPPPLPIPIRYREKISSHRSKWRTAKSTLVAHPRVGGGDL